MVKVVDVAYKAVAASLGIATIAVGGNLIFNMYRGMAWHLSNPQIQGEQMTSSEILSDPPETRETK